mmetsp:Transcript_691/g.2757  ORF Transcript_691/g.2757 Transcript_691/m.2757 type:complete len:376 (-) Transcript_691:89-1216(-)
MGRVCVTTAWPLGIASAATCQPRQSACRVPKQAPSPVASCGARAMPPPAFAGCPRSRPQACSRAKQKQAQQRHAHEEPVAHLPEVGGPGVRVHLLGDLVHAGQRVHHHSAGAQLVHHRAVNGVGALGCSGRLRRCEALLLHPGDVQHVRGGQELVAEAGRLGHLHACSRHSIGDVGRHLQPRRRDKVEPNFEQGQEARQGVDGAAVLEVAEHGDGEPVRRVGLPLRHDREEIQQGLGGVLAGAVPGVEHRDWRRRCGLQSSTSGWVSQHHCVAVAGHRSDGVAQSLALGHGGGRARHWNHAAAHPHHCCREGAARARRRLVEDVGQHLAFQKLRSPRCLDCLAAFASNGDRERKGLRRIKLLHRNDVPAFPACGI